MSLPVREVWIEINNIEQINTLDIVTSREGSVDWNFYSGSTVFEKLGHFPWGKCGLKFLHYLYSPWGRPSLPVREVWIEIAYGMML